MRTYNASKIALWNQCELKFCAYHLLKYKNENSQPSLRMELGTLVHKYFEDFYNPLQTQQFKTQVITLQAWKDDFAKTWNNLTENFSLENNQNENKAYLEQGILALENFYYREKERDFKIPIFLEKWFTVDLGQFRLNGKIDRIDREPDGSITILDYKIASRIKSSIEADKDIQLTIYHLACEEAILRETPTRIGLYYPVQNEIIYTKRNNNHLELTQSDILDIDLTIEERGYDPKSYERSPNDWKCEDCAYRNECPEHKIISFEELPDAEEIIEKTERFAELKAKEKELTDELEILKEEIKEYMKANELKEIGKCRLGSSSREEYDASKLWQLLRNIQNGYQYIKVDKKALEEDLELFTAEERRVIKTAKISKEPVYSVRVGR